ncbi:MAG TPA: carbon starvation CstA family protein [Planctomycetota bacterium]|nr:carbon starvation CstA family protein [Planctomycetota bacterium]
MSLPLLALLFVVLLAAGYRFWGNRVARQFALDGLRPTPAHVHADGADFVPTPPFYLFAQHFSAIAAAGPIAGPILACQSYGWMPCLLWISFGVVFIGAVHDFASLASSVRHGGRSIAEIAREQLGPRAGLAMLAFIWIALIYVIVAFADITAGTFVTGPEELAGQSLGFHPGGAVAAASTMYLGLALLMGLAQRLLRPPLWLLTLVFVPATFGVAWLGTHVSAAFVLDRHAWGLIILAYCAVASVTPVWALLQPRGYLGGFVLYSALAIGIIGMFFGGYEIRQPAFATADTTSSAPLFPFLFVTIACGACSGFHGLVCSGTTSKQVDNERHIQPVGYGAMLAEGFVALIALVTIMILAPGEMAGLPPGTIYGQGIGRFLCLLLGQDRLGFAVTFGAMAFSTFVFDTLDVTTRLGRYIIQELFGWKGAASAVLATVLTLALPACLLTFAQAGMWSRFWLLFGASNQLLAALTLLVITVWLARTGRSIAYTLPPMIFVLVITLWALLRIVVSSVDVANGFDIAAVNALAGIGLIALALYLAVTSLSRLAALRRAPRASSTG